MPFGHQEDLGASTCSFESQLAPGEWSGGALLDWRVKQEIPCLRPPWTGAPRWPTNWPPCWLQIHELVQPRSAKPIPEQQDYSGGLSTSECNKCYFGEGEMYGKSNMETYITICKIDSQWVAICMSWVSCMAQETQTRALHQSGGLGWGRREVQKGGVICNWFMLRFDRKQQNSVKQLSFN